MGERRQRPAQGVGARGDGRTPARPALDTDPPADSHPRAIESREAGESGRREATRLWRLYPAVVGPTVVGYPRQEKTADSRLRR